MTCALCKQPIVGGQKTVGFTHYTCEVRLTDSWRLDLERVTAQRDTLQQRVEELEHALTVQLNVTSASIRASATASSDGETVVSVPVVHPDWPDQPVLCRVIIYEGEVKRIETPTYSGRPEYFSEYVVEQVKRATGARI